MADVRPLPGIRYTAEQDIAALVAPPYDVISPDDQARYYEQHPQNIIRLELGREEPGDDQLDNRYTRAAEAFAEWRLHGVLAQDAPSLYVYEQRFSANGAEYRRVSLLARVRLEPWESGVVLPHERTLAKPKDDRLRLTRACAATLSPIMALYDDPDSEIAAILTKICTGKPRLAFTDERGEEHRLWLVQDEKLAATLAGLFAPRQLYIADGHHRYETALAYRDEVREIRQELEPDDAVNFTLMGLTAVEDPGLLVLPTHRIVRGAETGRQDGLDERLAPYFTINPLGAEPREWLSALADQAQQGATAFVLARPAGASLLQLKPEGHAAMLGEIGEEGGSSQAWRDLDVAILHELVLREGLGIGGEAVHGGEYVSYTRDAEEATRTVRDGTDGAQLALLLNPTPPAAIRDVARAGDRMPQKSTYFYPKLIAGLVINPLW
jgi:uncharacterized protein (DUF1015 family)